jgi:DNA polymerase III subunit delta'
VVERTGASLDVDEARRLVGLAQRRPFEGDRQVLVVTDVHLATRSAPALLKTVEEPPPSTVFVLLADHVPPELVTVASRCVEVAFPPVPASVIEPRLVAEGAPGDLARLAAQSCGGDVDRARLLVGDIGLVDRLALWQSVPSRLDGHGATTGELSRELLTAVEAALEPLRARHAEELRLLGEDAASLGARGVPGRKDVTDRQHREERRWRADELRAGLAVLARAYGDRLAADAEADRFNDAEGRRRARGCAEAVATITETAAAMRRNPNETLLLEGLLVRLSRIGV